MELEVMVTNYDGDLEDLGRAYQDATGTPYEAKTFDETDGVSFLLEREGSGYSLSAIRWTIEPRYNLVLTAFGDDAQVSREVIDEFAQITGIETMEAPTYLREQIENQMAKSQLVFALLDL